MRELTRTGYVSGIHPAYLGPLCFRIDGQDGIDGQYLLVELQGLLRGHVRSGELVQLQPISEAEALAYQHDPAPTPAPMPSGDPNPWNRWIADTFGPKETADELS